MTKKNVQTVVIIIIAAYLLIWNFSSKSAANPKVLMSTEVGDIIFVIYLDKAPISAGNFLKYVDEKRFISSSFYRVVTLENQPKDDVKIEVIQGGIGIVESDLRLDPIAHETTEMTGLRHLDGSLSMARSEPGSASSEFFVCIGDQPELDFGGRRNLDGQGFAVFGQLLSGQEIIGKIHSSINKEQMIVQPVKILSIKRINSD
ncbi:MAG: peptidylprolyl isomerase [Candidatus Neomarinimicrobiota bacterium]